MAKMVEDIVQALINLGGEAPLSQIYSEFERIRTLPLPKSWQANVRDAIQHHSPDSKTFNGNSLFKKTGRGIWALHTQKQVIQSPQPTVTKKKSSIEISAQHNSIAEVINILSTIKQYRDYQQPGSSTWKDYVKEILHLLGFSSKDIDGRFFTINALGTNQSPEAIVGYSSPGENFEEIVPGLQWLSVLKYAAHYHKIQWGILTNGLQLRVENFQNSQRLEPQVWPNFDGMITEERIDTFCTVHRVFSNILTPNNLTPEKKQPTDHRDDMLEFWGSLRSRALDRGKDAGKWSPQRYRFMRASKPKKGLHFNFYIRSHDAQVELNIYLQNKPATKQAFSSFYAHQSEIESAFGFHLDWQIFDQQKSSRIRYQMNGYGLFDRENWPILQDQMIDAMERFENAFRPFIQMIS